MPINGAQSILWDVAIIGYGPTGQMLAILLGQRGYRVAVFERWLQLYPLPRAVHYDGEVARILQGAGVAKELEAVVEPAWGGYEWRNASGETLQSFDSGRGAFGWPTDTMFAQPDLARILDAKVKSLPTVEVYQGWEAEQAGQEQNQIVLQVRRQTAGHSGELLPTPESQIVRARYLIGADGANSFLRTRMHPPMTDLGFVFDWLVIDVIPHEQREWNPPNLQVCDPARPTSVISGGKGRRRWEFMRLPGENIEELNRPETAWRLLEPWQITPQNATLERHTVYTFRACWADTWRKGRFFLAGDAAHLTPPFAGHGMGAGMRDGVNLAWKFDLVLSGRATETLLDTYTSERLPHVQQFIHFAVELGKVICISDPEAAAMRDARMLAASRQPNRATSSAPAFPLGPGILLEGDQLAGHSFIQGDVTPDGKRGRFDDVVGRGFCLISTEGDPASVLDTPTRNFFSSIGGLYAHVTKDHAEAPHRIIDVHGIYHEWFAAHQCGVVLTRPDYAVFGTAPDLEGAIKLVKILHAQLTASSRVEEKEPSYGGAETN
jgi:2-polyprenyl-6-methoxyphenol hydroxylase-like FAD-dependent oxidoreductase